MTKKRGLGRSLESLLQGTHSAVNPPEVNDPGVDIPPEQGELRHLPIEFLQRSPYQPRRDFDPDALEQLANSIRKQGIMQPVVVRPIADNHYELIAGERRWRAAQLVALAEIPALIRPVSDEAAMAMALIENIQRENLNAVEEAFALQRLVDEFGLTHQEVADSVGRSRVAVSNLLRLLSLHPDVQTLLEHGDLEMGHARALLSLAGEQQLSAARLVINRDLSVRATEKLVRQLQSPASVNIGEDELDPNIRRLQEDLSEKLGAEVKVQSINKKKGKLVITYNSLEELDGILAHIK